MTKAHMHAHIQRHAWKAFYNLTTLPLTAVAERYPPKPNGLNNHWKSLCLTQFLEISANLFLKNHCLGHLGNDLHSFWAAFVISLYHNNGSLVGCLPPHLNWKGFYFALSSFHCSNYCSYLCFPLILNLQIFCIRLDCVGSMPHST